MFSERYVCFENDKILNEYFEQRNFEKARSTDVSFCSDMIFSSLLRGDPKQPHADGDELFHREPVCRGPAGHHHLSAAHSGGGHHGDMVLRRDHVQDHTLLTGNVLQLFSHFQKLKIPPILQYNE